MDSKDGSPASDGGDDGHLVALRAGYRVGHYTIVSILGEGGFGITYRARDETLRRDVAVKEYLPVDLAVRDRDTTIRPRSKADVELYQWGLQRFVDEGRTLAALDAPGIVRVYDFVEANGTAYMVMELVQGESLAHRLDRAGPLSPTELTAMAGHLLQGLDIVHRAGYLHRDIKPANILIRPTGHAVLVDFGAARAARRPGTGGSRALTSVYTPGYAPPEQYAGDGSDQGPWTDLYALAATLYEAVTGHAPPDATSRLMSDRMVPAREVAAGRHAPAFLAGIDAALALRREQRPQTVATWLAMLRGDTAATIVAPGTVTPGAPRKPPPPPRLTAASEGRPSRSPSAAVAPSASIQRPIQPAPRLPVAPQLARPDAQTAAASPMTQMATASLGLLSRPIGAPMSVAGPSPPRREPLALYVAIGVAVVVALGGAGWLVARAFAPAGIAAPPPSPAADAAARTRAAEEAARVVAEARRLAEEEQRTADEARRRAVEAERLAAREASLKAETDARLRADEERQLAAERDKAKADTARLAAEEQARLAEAAHLAAEEQARAAEAARLKAEEDRRRAADVAEADRVRAAAEARRKADDERRRTEDIALQQAAEAARQRAAEQARLKAEIDRRLAEEAARQRAAEQARPKAEVERPAPQPRPVIQSPPAPSVAPAPSQHAGDGIWSGQADIRTHARTGVCEEGFTVRGNASAGNWTGTTSNGLRLAMTIGPDGIKPTRVSLDGRDPPAWLGDLRLLTLELRDGCVYRIRFTRQ